MVRPNKVRECMRNGVKARGFGMSFACPTIIELLGQLGFDYMSIDAEHGAFTIESAEEAFRAAEGVGLSPFVRVPDHEPSTILRFMDRGAMGITAPHVSTRDQAERIVEAVKYGPQGKRGLGFARANNFGVAGSATEYIASANNESMITIQLETVEGHRNLDEILKVDGIDLFAFGAYDLSQSMGVPGQNEHPKVLEAIAVASAKIKAAGKRLSSDVMSGMGVQNVLADAAKGILAQPRAKIPTATRVPARRRAASARR